MMMTMMKPNNDVSDPFLFITNSSSFSKSVIALGVGLVLILGVGCGGGDDEASAGDLEYNAPGFYEIPESEVPEIEIPEPVIMETVETAAKPEGVKTLPSQEEDETEAEIMQDFADGLEEANDALESFVDDNGRFPKNMNEVLAQGELSQLPKAPPGKKLGWDRATRKLIWKDK